MTYVAGTPGLKARQLKRILAPGRFDVVHFHLVTLVGGPGRAALRRRRQALHDARPLARLPDVRPLAVQPRALRSPECLRCTLSFRRPPQLWRYTRWSDTSPTSTSSSLRAARRSSSIARAASPTRCGICRTSCRPATRPSRLATSRAALGPYFLFVGRLVKLKGVQTLIEAFRRYDSADLLIAGDGVYGDELRRQAEGSSTSASSAACIHASCALSTRAPSPCSFRRSSTRPSASSRLEAFAQRTPVIAHEHGAVGSSSRRAAEV